MSPTANPSRKWQEPGAAMEKQQTRRTDAMREAESAHARGLGYYAGMSKARKAELLEAAIRRERHREDEAARIREMKKGPLPKHLKATIWPG